MKTNKIVAVCAGSFCFCFAASLLAVGLDKPTANLTEKFVTSAGWEAQVVGDVAAGWVSNECIQVSYPARDPGATGSQIGKLVGGVNASFGVFSGDLSAMDALSFDVKSGQWAYTPVLTILSASGTKWIMPLHGVDGMTFGDSRTLTVPLIYSSDVNVCYPIPGPKTQSDFVADMKAVVEIGFSTMRDANHYYAQQMAIDNLKLIGPWGTNLVDGVPYAWALEYGLTNSLATVGIDDGDGDGFTNLAEFLAGTDPNNSNSYFRVNIGRNDQGTVVVKWNDNKYMRFTLLESSNLVTFTAVQNEANVMGVGTQRVVEVNNADVSGVRFYKVQISQ